MRRFYTTLIDQKPESEMARRWCAMTGLLSKQDAEQWVAEQARKKGAKSPSKAAVKRPSSGVSKRKSTAAADDEGDFKSAKKKKVTPTAKSTGSDTKKKSVKAPVAKSRKEVIDDDDDDDDSDAEIIPKAKHRSTSSKKLHPKKRDVAFTDGGMDGSDSDDDVPLVQRMKTAA